MFQSIHLTLDQIDRHMAIFDFDEDVIIMIGNKPINSSIFDYFNPLLISTDLIGTIQFYSPNSCQPLSELDCMELLGITSKIQSAVKSSVGYPNMIVIDYLSKRVIVGEKARSFNSYFHPENTSGFSIGIPILSTGHNFLQFISQ